MKLQTIACAVAIATGGSLFTHAINEAIAATETTAVTKQAIVPSQDRLWCLVNWRPWLTVNIISINV